MEVVLGLWDQLVHVLQGVLREEGGGVPQQVGPIELNIKCGTLIKAQAVTGFQWRCPQDFVEFRDNFILANK